MNTETFVIVGASLTGAKAAETLREEGFAGRVILIGAEPERPYERPALSKDYLRGESEREGVYVHGASFYPEQGIELRLGETASELDLAQRELTLRSGERIRFDKLLLATGAAPRRLSLTRGGQLQGIHYLRTLSDSDALREHFAAGARLAVVGAGWIGSEVAASARQQGLEVTLIDPLSVPLERVLGRELGSVYRDLHVDHGVELLPGATVYTFEGRDAVERVRLEGGRTVECDLVVVGIGASPRAELARAAGLAVEDGILVDGSLRTTAPAVFAAGDVANHLHPHLGRLRVEHWANALNQGPAVARSMLGNSEPYARAPYFFSDQYELGMEYTGYARDWDEIVFRGDPAGREFIAFWLKEGRVQAGMNVNVWDVAEQIKALLGQAVEPEALADPQLLLDELAEARSPEAA